MPRRNTILGAAVALVIMSLAGASIVAVLAWNQLRESADRLVAIGDAMAAATLLLSALAAAIALVAYVSSTASPDLEAEVAFRCSEANQPVFLVEEDAMRRRQRLVSFRQVEASVRIHNRRSISGHNPAMRVDLLGMGGIPAQRGWRPVEWANYGVCGVQWDGGVQYAIHGSGTRVLPPLTLDGVVVLPDEAEHALLVTLVADGFARTWTMPVELLGRDEYLRHSQERADRHAGNLTLEELCGLPDCDRPAAIRVLMFQAKGAPVDAAVCAGCTGWQELRSTTPTLPIVDNLDMKRLHDSEGRHVMTDRGLG